MRWATCIVLVLLTTLCLYLHRTRLRLIAENRALAIEVATLRDEAERLIRSARDPAELENARRDQAELVRLRGEAASLRQRVREATNALAKASRQVKAREPEPTPMALPISSYEAKISARVPLQQTLLTGGWLTKEGKRTLLFVTPESSGDSQILLQTRWLEASDQVLESLGLQQFRAESEQSELNVLFTSDQMRDLLKAAEQTTGVDLLSAPRVITANDRLAQVKVVNIKTFDGAQHEIGPSVDLRPRLTADNSAVDVDVSARLNLLRTPQ
jgi:hypothetical protein